MMAARTPAARVPLTADRIIDTAIAYTRRHGTAALSMRKLAAELGVEAMSLYHHVANRKTLETLMVDRALSPLPPTDPTMPWDQQLMQLLLGLYHAGVAHPIVVPALAAELTRPTQDTARPGGSAAAATARILQLLRESPLPAPQQRAAGCGAISLVLGAILAQQTVPDPPPPSTLPDHAGNQSPSRKGPPSSALPAPQPKGANDLQLTLRWLVLGITGSPHADATGS